MNPNKSRAIKTHLARSRHPRCGNSTEALPTKALSAEAAETLSDMFDVLSDEFDATEFTSFVT